MSFRQRLTTWLTGATLAAVLAISWISIALAEVGTDGDGFDGDELGLPIVLGVGVLAYVAWLAVRRWQRKSS